ncbi:uncharacterized protein VTP21DRAFT_6749 [Calcarisporiella thermophila]|uniref:uncharacterized protein n=1 Tax=Calcarisporiella thermophila TaxID=911321 RepID=UPI0037428808
MFKFIAIFYIFVAASSAFTIPNVLNFQNRPLQFGAKELGLRLISTNDYAPPVWMTEPQIQLLKIQGKKFIDVTDEQNFNPQLFSVERPAIPKDVSHQDEVKNLLKKLSLSNLRTTLTKFTSFRNRYYRSKYGVQSASWLYTYISDVIASSKSNITLIKYKHDWEQFSIIARFPGTTFSNETIVVSAHQDSINAWLPSIGRAPGADDDGSGTVSILEAFRVLAASNYAPKRTVEFHWYSAEEAGLLGSQAVAREYRKLGRIVGGVLHYDMTGWAGGKEEVMGVITDYVDKELVALVIRLIENYVSIPWKYTKCGYACSDHASWTKNDYPSAIATEARFEDTNHNIHSSDDTIDKLNFEHMLEFSKLAVGFAVEMGYAH